MYTFICNTVIITIPLYVILIVIITIPLYVILIVLHVNTKAVIESVIAIIDLL